MNYLTQEQWKDFTESNYWRELKEYLIEVIELNRDLMEGLREQKDSQKESTEVLRGRNRTARELIANIEGWADGSIPLEGNFIPVYTGADVEEEEE